MNDNPSDSIQNPPLTLEAVVAGHLCLDIIPGLLGPLEFAPGTLVETSGVTMATGGAVSNTGLALNRLGVATRLVGRVGDDPFGVIVKQILASEGASLADGIVTSATAQTSYTIILNPPQSDRMFLHCSGSNAEFDHGDIDYGVVAKARLFHYGYPTVMERMYSNGGASFTALFQGTKATGVTTSLDLCMPDMTGASGKVDWAAVLARTMPFVDIILPSIDELLISIRPSVYHKLNALGDIVDQATPELLADLSAELVQMGAKVIVIKLGHRGLYLRTAGEDALHSMGRGGPADSAAWANRELWSPCFSVEVVGTTGAGDATIAGFLMAMLRGMSPQDALTAANAVGACSVESPDALGGVQPWPATAARIQAGWGRRPGGTLPVDWMCVEGGQLWIGPNDRVGLPNNQVNYD